MHGTNDRIIPFSQGKALFDLAREPKTFVPVHYVGHNDLIDIFGFENYSDMLLSFISKYNADGSSGSNE
jgi:fermentation-respiration switch protein FrsA (DUF1100 family)